MANTAPLNTDKVARNSVCGRFLGWIDDRFPLTVLWNSQVAEYYAPKNFNVWYYFG